MQVNIYSIYDSKAKAYLQPWFAANNLVAFRNCERSAKQPGSPFAEFPGDFTVFKLAEFNDDTGEVMPLKAHENLGTFVQFLPVVSASDKAA